MKTAITCVMDLIEIEHNNNVEISKRVLWKMLLEAKEKEKQQIINAYREGVLGTKIAEQYYSEKFK